VAALTRDGRYVLRPGSTADLYINECGDTVEPDALFIPFVAMWSPGRPTSRGHPAHHAENRLRYPTADYIYSSHPSSCRLCPIMAAVKPFLLVSALLSTIAACGGGGSEGTAACTMGSGIDKTCIEIPSDPDDIQTQNDACVNVGGVASLACSHDGADGACQVSSTASGDSQTVTYWYYAGNAASEKASCISYGETWLTP